MFIKKYGLAFFLAAIIINTLSFVSVRAQDLGSIEGTVSAPNNGGSVANATVEIIELKRVAISDVVGNYRFTKVPAGNYTIKITADGFNSFSVSNVNVGSAATTQDISFESIRGSRNQVDVVGTDTDAIAEIPGSLAVISGEELRKSHPIDANEVLRRVSGVVVREDSGPVGLRLNIGIRGLNPDRSRQILVLEDGIPLSLAPYGEPELYYSPPIDRMQRVEVLKGNGSILYGPQTVGGVINFITPDPPQTGRGSFELVGGQRGFLNVKGGYGNTIGKLGFYGSILRKQGDGFRNLNFGLTDFTGKLNYAVNDKHIIGGKISIYNEDSNSTYVGLTQNMFLADPNQNPASDDLLDVKRQSFSVNHQFLIDDTSSLNTTAYYYKTVRDWRRQDFERARVAGRTYTGVFGDESIPGGAIFMRNSAGGRNREFYIGGIESRYTKEYSIAGNRSTFKGGFQYLHEHAIDSYIIGATATSSNGIVRDYETRPADAFSFFLQNRFTIGKKFTVTPGLRFESYQYNRHITTIRVGGVPTSVNIRGEDKVSEFIPGIGVTYQPIERLTIFAGVHRGFAPPRVKDAVDTNGSPVQLDAEFSWNTEVGVRYNGERGFNAEATFFNLDFKNQIIPASQSGGATSTLINAGETTHRGFEFQTGFDFGKLFKIGQSITADFRYTNIGIARFDNGIYRGNRLPYAPENVFSFIAGYRHPTGFGAQYDISFIGDQFADNAQTVAPSANGEIGLVPSYKIHNLSLDYEFRYDRFSFLPFVTIKNLTDEIYIASRAPQGIQPGLFRQANFGIRFQF